MSVRLCNDIYCVLYIIGACCPFKFFVSLGLVYKNCILNFVSQLYLLDSLARVLSWDTTLKKAVVGVMQARKQRVVPHFQ